MPNKSKEIGITDILSFQPEKGRIDLGGERVLLLNASSMGVLRKALIDTVGQDYARRLFNKLGFACGYQDALTVKKHLSFKDDRQWLLAGPRTHMLEGCALVEPVEFRLDKSKRDFYVKGFWRDSYEAAEHERFLGPSREPVCWSLAGYASGWSSAVLGERALCVETSCQGRGDARCELEIKRLSEWDARTREQDSGPEGAQLPRGTSLLEGVLESLKASQETERRVQLQFRALFDFAADMIWIRELWTGKVLDANEATFRTLGLPRERVVGRPVHELYSDGDAERARRFSQSVERDGSGYMVTTFRTGPGTLLEVELRGSLIDHAGGKAMLVVARHIGESLKDQRRAHLFYEGFKRSNDVMFYTDKSGVIQDVNEAFTRHYGWRREEAIGQTPRLVRSRHTTDEVYKRMWGSILDPAKGYWKGEIINKAKDGREIPLILTITAVRDQASEIIGYISNAVDLTEQVALQGRVAQSESLAALGEMAAVVAHEIRNPLGSIVMASKQLAQGRLSAEDRATVLSVLRAESQRLNEALSNFLAYARPRELKLGRGNLNAIAEEVLGMVRSNEELMGSVTVSVSLDTALKSFPMDTDQIRQVVWNIAINALQALQGRGTLEVATGREGPNAFLRLRDSGPGISERALPALFKPFQTTKQQGTGLGLAIADRIVKAHGGRIAVDTRAGEGACFTVHLPCVEE